MSAGTIADIAGKTAGITLVLVLATAGLAAQVVEGTVVDGVTGAPIADASVEIENAGKAPYQTTSDAHGAFRIEGVADGSYTALAFKNGFLTVQDETARRPFRVVAGLDPIHLTLSLTPRGRVAGRVMDAENRPVAGANVRLLSSQSSGSGQTETTGKDGSFMFEIAPGAYFLSARPPVGLAPPAAVGDQVYAWAETWYPGVSKAGEAQKVVIRPGVELLDQNLKLRAVNAYTIRGEVRQGNGDPAASVAVKLVRAEETAQGVERSTVAGKDGGFEFAGAYDGDWRLSVERGGEVIERAFAHVTITGLDADGVELRLSPPFRLPVEFLLATDDATTKIQSDVVLGPDGGGPAPVLEKLYPGRYLVNPLTPAGYYVASVKLGDQDILGRMAEFSPESAPLKIVYRADGGTLRGTVEDCGKATVAVAPEEPILWRGDPYSVRFARCTESGQFEMRGLRPGKYYAFAFDQGQIDRAAFLGSLPDLINRAVTVEVQAKETANVELKVSAGI